MAEPISKEEWLALQHELQDRNVKAIAEVLRTALAQWEKVLEREEVAEAPSPEDIAKQAERLRERMRDGFAAAAVSGMLAAPHPLDAGDIARSAYDIADAMLAVRKP